MHRAFRQERQKRLGAGDFEGSRLRHSSLNVSRPDFDTPVFSLIFPNKSRKK
jgi:hypothetical protein